MHHSSLLWDAPLEGEEVPSVLTCCHRDKGLLEDVVVLDPRIATYIIDAGLDGLLRALSPGPLTIRWKGAKITTEHGMHILRAYCVSLALLRPNQCFFSSMVHVISRDQLCHHRSTDSCQSSQLKMENYALKARIVAAERLDVLHKKSCKNSNVLHKILSAFSFFNGWGQCLLSGG
nr:hypothetical protein CFP56_44896 [Quercus suber]